MGEHELELDSEAMCNICAQTFSTEAFLWAHLMENHESEEPAIGSG